jgi:hypothetical protein
VQLLFARAAVKQQQLLVAMEGWRMIMVRQHHQWQPQQHSVVVAVLIVMYDLRQDVAQYRGSTLAQYRGSTLAQYRGLIAAAAAAAAAALFPICMDALPLLEGACWQIEQQGCGDGHGLSVAQQQQRLFLHCSR